MIPLERRKKPLLAAARKRRIALYSHDTMGIGHTRRNLLLAQILAVSPVPTAILIIAGAREIGAFTLPPGADCLTLPSLHKELNGVYRPRCLNVSLKELIEVRSRVIHAGLDVFQPDVLIVDKEPRGAFRELDPVLDSLRQRGRTRCVLGLRDVLDEPDTVKREWRAMDSLRAVRDYYDAIWIYGDPSVYDLVHEYDLPPDVAERARYTGYLDRHLRSRFTETDSAQVLAELAEPGDRLALCMVGGGQDGGQLAEAFAEATLPAQGHGVILMGPFMPPEVQQRLRRRAAGRENLRVVEFVTDPDILLNRADRVVAMGGYNTIFEVLSAEKHALIVPRVRPRREQAIRAERLRDRGLLHVLPPDQVSPAALTDWLARDLGPAPRVRESIDLNGAARVPQLLEEVLSRRLCPVY